MSFVSLFVEGDEEEAIALLQKRIKHKRINRLPNIIHGLSVWVE